MSENKKDFENTHNDDVVFIDFAQVEEVSRVFFEEAKEILEELDAHILRLEQSPADRDQINLLFRKVHTIKGSVGAVPGGQLLGSLAHEFEALLGRLKRESRPADKTCIDLFLQSSRMLRVLSGGLRDKRDLYPEELSETIELITHYGSFQFSDEPSGTALVFDPTTALQSQSSSASEDAGVWLSVPQLNEFLRLSGELLVLKNFYQMMNQTVNFRLDPDLFERRQTDFSQSLGKIVDQFHGQVQSVRKETVGEALQGLHVLTRQASTELNKNVKIEIRGEDLLIDKALGKDIYEALVHIVRNSIDHGIEDQFERTVQGKTPNGTLSLEIFEKNNSIHLVFEDDGKGLDKDRILQKALSSGLVTVTDSQALSDSEIYGFIFKPGFSTKDKVTTMSGRGVGMDVVHMMIQKYQGRIAIENRPGQGACFKMEIPIPQFVMVESALLSSWQDYQFAFPITAVVHISSCHELQFNQLEHLRFCQFAGKTVPVVSYSEIILGKIETPIEEVRRMSTIFIKSKNSLFALLVHRIEAQTDLVVKKFGSFLKDQRGFKGISILADGRACYIVDPDNMVELLSLNEKTKAAA